MGNETPENGMFELNVKGSGALADALKALLNGRDRVLMKAINFKIGEDWSITDIVKRGEFIAHNDRREVFLFDGAELVEFYPHETVMLANSLSITQKYRKLYEAANATKH